MELDRQTLIVICAAVVGLTLFGGFYLAAPTAHDATRPLYAQDDVRYQLQQEEQKKKKKKSKKTTSDDADTSSFSSSGGDDSESAEEPSLDDGPQEEPPLD
jgi:hypothetical protein